jgi:rod shape determining protein RodA
MIYSATINTLGVENPVQRQIIYVLVGTVILLIAASVDYHLLELVQHPFAILAPLLLAMANVLLIITWRVGQTPGLEDAPSLDLFMPDLPVMILGVGLTVAVFVTDRFWIETLDLMLARVLAAIMVVGAAAAGALLLIRLAVPLSVLLVGGLAGLYFLDCLTLRFTDALRNPVYVVILGLLGIVFVAGQVSGGAQRWLGAGAVQPSELSKILVVVVLARFLANREDRLEHVSTVIVSLGIAALPMVLIYLQPDLGTALTFVAIWGAMVWMAGTRFRHLLVLAGGGLAALPLVWLNLEEYMRQRLLLFLSPTSDPDSYFNVHQALVSIGSGGWTGKGLTRGTQSQLHFLRVRHTDFVFAVTAEELGFLGAVVMMGLVLFILWRILRIADRSRDALGRLIAVGVAAVILFQSTVNIGMNLGLMPVTGIPLPFVSYGGSSYVTLMLGIGLVQSVAMRRKKLEFD